uniref:Predicted protein n=1 Tax=Physcomitrium patens TaxID=3218 RepID=A9U6W1_PHYPA
MGLCILRLLAADSVVQISVCRLTVVSFLDRKPGQDRPAAPGHQEHVRDEWIGAAVLLAPHDFCHIPERNKGRAVPEVCADGNDPAEFHQLGTGIFFGVFHVFQRRHRQRSVEAAGTDRFPDFIPSELRSCLDHHVAVDDLENVRLVRHLIHSGDYGN